MEYYCDYSTFPSSFSFITPTGTTEVPPYRYGQYHDPSVLVGTFTDQQDSTFISQTAGWGYYPVRGAQNINYPIDCVLPDGWQPCCSDSYNSCGTMPEQNAYQGYHPQLQGNFCRSYCHMVALSCRNCQICAGKG